MQGYGYIFNKPSGKIHNQFTLEKLYFWTNRIGFALDIQYVFLEFGRISNAGLLGVEFNLIRT